MKKLLSIIIIFYSTNCFCQQDSSYLKMLNNAPEFVVADSLEIKTEGWQLQRLDSNDVKKWFAPLLGSLNNNRLKNRSYYLAGKVTVSPDFNLVLLVEEKRKTDTVEILHLITTKKDGKYISSLEAAVSGTRKKSNYNISSLLYSDFKIRKDSRIIINEKQLNDMEIYKINTGGRFILYPDN